VTVRGPDPGPALPNSGACGITARDGPAGAGEGDLGQLVSGSLPPGSFGALLRACRHRACLSQEQLAARAELSERTVRNLEAGRVRSPRFDTVRLLAGALRLGGPERESWVAAARDVTHQRGGPAAPSTGGPAQLPGNAPAPPPLSVQFRHGNQPPAPPFARQESQAEIAGLCQRPDRPAPQAGQDSDLIRAAVRARAGQVWPDAGTGRDSQLTGAERLGLAELRRETRRLREDVEILKHAAAIFTTAASEPLPGSRAGTD
jgi:transposase